MKSRHGIIILLEIIGCSHRVAKPWLVPMELDRGRSVFVLDVLIRTLLFILSHINRSFSTIVHKVRSSNCSSLDEIQSAAVK
jgi:hypothetical protein